MNVTVFYFKRGVSQNNKLLTHNNECALLNIISTMSDLENQKNNILEIMDMYLTNCYEAFVNKSSMNRKITI